MNPPSFAKASAPTFYYLGTTLLIFLALASRVHAQAGVLPTGLIDPGSPESAAQVSVKQNGQVAASVGPEGVAVTIKPGEDGYPGVTIKPARGSA